VDTLRSELARGARHERVDDLPVPLRVDDADAAGVRAGRAGVRGDALERPAVGAVAAAGRDAGGVISGCHGQLRGYAETGWRVG
jgi:hypothetical protein